MTTLADMLHEKKEAIVQSWLEDVLATYSPNAAAVFGRQKDPFANPVGHTLRVGTRGLIEALFDGADVDTLRPHLEEMIKLRAVQQFSASQAVGFVFRLKDAIRAALGETVKDATLSPQLAALEGQIDRVALLGFDMYVQCREQVYELRVNEVKRKVSWVMKKLNQRPMDPNQEES